ncbi:MAG: dihydrodipicolinate synthase family protein, partial [Promethearchaeota archaeon]
MVNFSIIEGLIPATYTPFKEDYSVNLEQVGAYAAFLYKNGIKCIFLNGSTGETFSLSVEERMALVDEWMNTKPEDMKVIVHVSSLCLDDAKKMAAHAQKAGADAICTTACFYFKAPNLESVVDNCAIVAAAAPELPYFYYHIPSRTGVTMNMVGFMQDALKKIPTFAGLKYTHNNLMEFNQCIQIAKKQIKENNRHVQVLSGFDEMLVAYMSFGSKGAVGTTYSFLAPLYLDIMKNFNSGNITKARDLQEVAN